MADKPKLLVATNNAGKVEEFCALLADCGWEVVGPADLGLKVEVEESGASYRENALLKAAEFSKVSGLAAIADDSGLEVDALGGEPGPLHHLKGWDGADQEARVAELLAALQGGPEGRRTARFRAVLVAVLQDGNSLESEGVCEGEIGHRPVGPNGFGYDPVFLPSGLDQTMAQLSLEQKNSLSHRARAAQALLPLLARAARAVNI